MAAGDPYSLDEEERKKNQQAAPTGQAVLPPQQVQPATQPPGRNPSPTNFTNFARRFSANKQTSQQQANKYAGQAQGAVGKAAGSLAGAQTTFAAGVNSGSVAPPPGTNAPSATNTGAAAAPPTPAAPPPQQPNRSGYQQVDEDSMIAMNGFSGPNRRADWIAAGSPDASGQPTQPVGASSSAALESESTRPAAPPVTSPPTGAAAPTLAEMMAQAGKQYTGPAGLDTTQATPDALAAQEQLDALKDSNGIQELVNESGNSGTRGADALSGALIGTAGRKDFDALRARFNPNKDLLDAQAAATKQAADAKDASGKNATAWGQRADEEQARETAASDAATASKTAAEQAAEKADKSYLPPQRYEQTYGRRGGDTPQNRRNFMMSGVDQKDPAAVRKRAEEIEKYEAAQKMTTQQQMDSTFEDFNDFSGLSPSSTATMLGGTNTNLQGAAQKQYGGQLSLDKDNQGAANAASGSTSQNHIPWDKAGVDGFFVWRQMTPDDWKTLNSKPKNGPNGQIAWIQTKERQLRNAAQSGQG